MPIDSVSTEQAVCTAPFKDLCTLTDRADGAFDAVIDPIWTIGPKVHGGVMLAVCAAAARRKLREAAEPDAPAQHMQPIVVSADYLGAPNPGEVILRVDVRKIGRQVCLAEVELVQEDRVAVRASVTLGLLDEEPPVHQHGGTVEQSVAPDEHGTAYEPDSPMGKIVNVAKGCTVVLDTTSAPFLQGKQGEPAIRLWAKAFDADEQDADTSLLFAMMVADISPPVVMNRGMMGWAPTVQMTVYLQRRPATGWLRVQSSSKSVGVGSFDEDHVVLDSTGAIVAQSRQLALLPRSR